ncbi:hypothetical protein JBE04_35630 [Streptomyces sp. PRKS01-29]|nr:hypothetical protein [Streptomyces sabulosicollis]MBI0299650.1 hypothetical protein [Streptomyces sabulosicollis]
MGLLSWLVGHRRSGTGPAAGNTAGTGSETVASPTAPPATPGWREVPPLQRTVAAPELVTDPAGFRAGLGTWQNASFLGTLGHLVSPEAPSGVGHGLATPLTPPTPSPADTPNPIRRTPPTVSREVGPVVARELATPRRAPVQRVAEDAAAPGTRVAEDAVTPDTWAAEDAATPDAPEVVEPLISARPPDERIRQLAALPLAAPRARTEASDAAPATSPSLPSPPVQRSAAFGLGEPLTELPPTAQREPAARAGALTPEEPGAAPTEPPRGDAPSRPLLPDDPLLVRTADTGPAPEPTAAPASAAPPVPLQRATAAGTPIAAEPAPVTAPVVPLVGQRSVPLFSGAHEASPAPSRPVPEQPVVPVRWSAAADPSPAKPEAAATGGPPSAHRPATPTAQRSVAPEATAPPAPVTRGHRPLASAPTTAPTGPARPLVDTGSAAVASGVAQRMADGSVVFQPPRVPSAPPPRAIQRARVLPPVQRDAEGPDIPDIPDPPEPPEPPESPEPPEPPEPPPSGPSSGPSPGPSPGGAPGGPEEHGDGGKGGGSPRVDDELVRALYAPLSRLLKAELRLERERAGHLINTRH